MSAPQICEVEHIVQDIIQGKKPVYARETPLSVAKEIQGLRAVFDEVRKEGGEVCGRGKPRYIAA